MNPQGGTKPPSPHNQVSVVAQGGITHVSLTDNNPRTSHVHNFVEWSHDRNFGDAQTIHLGVGRQVRIPTFMGGTPIYVRSFAQYPDGPRSEFTYHGSMQNPLPILDGAAVVGPHPPASTGSGTSSTPGNGFGREPFVSSPKNPGHPPQIF